MTHSKETVVALMIDSLNAQYEEAMAVNATYKHMERAARLLVEGFDNQDQAAIDSGLAGLREIFSAWDADSSHA